ncbi:MAG: TonB family protein [Calditrichae bacterium]|nr:TonB family protein [Calditrichia bacterium]
MKYISLKFQLLLLSCFLIACHPQKKDDANIVYPRLLSKHISLQYPPEAFDNRIEGLVILHVLVDEQGKVARARVYQSSGSDLLDQSALEMIKNAEFEPGIVDGEIRELWIKQPVDFRLDKKELSWFVISEWREAALMLLTEIYSDSTSLYSGKLKNLFYKYQFMVHECTEYRSLNANRSILTVVDKPLSEKWKEFEDLWPLGFILYQDYMVRFPESYYAKICADELVYYLEKEISILEQINHKDMQKTRLLVLLSAILRTISETTNLK